MSQHVIEGTWEEIERRKAELLGHRLRVTIAPERPTTRKPNARAKIAIQAKELHGYGMLAGILSTEDYFREKREDMNREDQTL